MLIHTVWRLITSDSLLGSERKEFGDYHPDLLLSVDLF